jgi:hypothetical protein
MRIIEIIEGKESNLVDEFLKSTTQKYNKRDMCGPACLDFIDWARREKGIDLKRVRGEFIADEVVSAKADFTPEMKKEFFRSGLDWNSAEDRKAWIEQSKYAEEWKGVPHYWTVDDKGNIHDPSGYQQLIKTGLAKDLDPSRYIPEGIKENFADGKEKGLDGKACWKGYKIGSPKTKMKGGKRVDNCVKENVGDTWNVGDKFLVNTDDPKNKKLTVDKIKGNKLLGSDTKWYSKYGVTKESVELTEEITLSEDQNFHEEYGYLGYSVDENDLFEAEYQGRKVKLNKPTRGDVKKFKVYVKNEKGNVIKVNFGHGGTSAKRPTMRIRKSNPKARKSFRARHNCANPGPKTKARYWSCRAW